MSRGARRRCRRGRVLQARDEVMKRLRARGDGNAGQHGVNRVRNVHPYRFEKEEAEKAARGDTHDGCYAQGKLGSVRLDLCRRRRWIREDSVEVWVGP